jgi:hypothetical protein
VNRRRIFEQKLCRIPELVTFAEQEITWRRNRHFRWLLLNACIAAMLFTFLNLPLWLALMAGYVLAVNGLIWIKTIKRIIAKSQLTY